MTLRKTGAMPVSRRDVLRYGLGGLAAGALAGPAAAQTVALGGSSVEWEQRFDSGPSGVRLPNTSMPLLSSQTLQATEAAVQQYATVEAQGGWPMLPDRQVLKLGTRHRNVAVLRQRLMVSGDLPANAGMSETFDSYVDAAVRRFQARHGVARTGVVAEATQAALNVPTGVRRRQLETNISRLRSLSGPLGERYVMVNIPAASIEAVEAGQVALRHTAIVGKPDRASPTLNVRIQEINFNPFWTVPASIIRKDLIPKMQTEPDYLTKNKIRIYDQRGNELTSEQVNWHSTEAMNYRFRQDPGELNSMGSIRINMPNKDGVYMHDTPSKGLFGDDFRFHSSGCVRVQNVRELVTWLLKRNNGWDRSHIDAAIRSGERIDVRLAAPVPVHWVYISGWTDADGITQFRDDIYGRDGLRTLAAG